MVKQLALSPADFASSDALKQWVIENKDQKYVPLELLRTWKIAAS